MKRTWSTVLDQDGLKEIQKKYGYQSMRPGFIFSGTCHPISGTNALFVIIHEEPISTTIRQDPNLSEESLIKDLGRLSLINQVFLNAQHILPLNPKQET